MTTPSANALDNELLKASLSPIGPLLDDPLVTDIMVYGSRRVYVRRQGFGFERVETSWLSDEDLMTAAKTIGRQMARRLDHLEPILDARLPDRSRVNVIIEPCYTRGACIVIRKFPFSHLAWSDLISLDSIDAAGVRIIEAVVRLGRNTLISGSTGSGKTTLLNCLCSFIGDSNIVVTVEDVREISLHNELWIALESKHPMNADDREISLRELVRTSLRMNPQWLVVGEVRGAEALDLVRAFNTGHYGAGTIHANSAHDSLLALENLILQSGLDVSGRAVKEMVARAIHVVIQVAQLPNHSRKVLEIAEVQGLDYERSQDLPPYKLSSLYRFEFSRYDENRKAEGRFALQHKPSWLNQLHMVPDCELPDFWTDSAGG
jgi:pilus assembly protein CpaF